VAEVTRLARVTLAGSPGLPGEGATVVAPATNERAVIGEVGALDRDGRRRVEVVVDGWRFELLVEDERHARLRERATRERTGPGSAGGSTEIRAMIPGRVIAVAVAAGDAVQPGDQLLVVEAMKMQNELRATRAGVVERVAVGAGATVELHDLLVVLG
jgi:biotin carboxyl carrier protein